jgi:hypothetical protein
MESESGEDREFMARDGIGLRKGGNSEAGKGEQTERKAVHFRIPGRLRCPAV